MVGTILNFTAFSLIGVLGIVLGFRMMFGIMSEKKKALYARMPIFAVQIKFFGFFIFIIGLSFLIGSVACWIATRA